MKKPFVYEKLKRDILQQIKNKRLKPNDRILSENELSRKYKISLKSVRKALSELREQNILVTHKGKGTFVVDRNKTNKNSSKLIGLIVADLCISFHSEIARACEDQAHRNGYHIIIGNTDNIAEKEEVYMRRFLAEGVAGAIVVTGKSSLKNKYFQYFARKIPVVIVDTYIEGVRADFVTTDDISGGYEAVCHFISSGHRKIVHLSGPADISTAKQRMEGYKKALNTHNIPIDEGLIYETDFTEASGYECMLKFLQRGREATAVFAVTDMCAVGAIKAIRERGLKVPEDISVIGYGDIKGISDIPLSTVSQPTFQMGKISAEILFEKIKGNRGSGEIKEVVLPTKLIIRKSSEKPVQTLILKGRI